MDFGKWVGRCSSCGEWNSVVEMAVPKARSKAPRAAVGAAPVAITELSRSDGDRISTGIGEFDRVLGGGLVRGSAVLVGGDPGIGKSTLMLQAAGAMAAAGLGTLYVTGEESGRQIRLRAERLGAMNAGLVVYAETSAEAIAAALVELRPAVVVMDSIQTVACASAPSSPGSVAQVRESAAALMAAARAQDAALLLVGHVTKDGMIAGPRVLEHMVDTVLYFEGERGHAYRILRAVKNRYGSAMEIGVFEMTGAGLAEVTNPSEAFLSERPEGASGSAVAACIEGTRPILCEIQALTAQAPFGAPRRTVVGIDYNRVLLLAAVLEKKAGITLVDRDIFIKVAGGLRIDEPAADLAVAAAIVSNHLERPVDEKTVIFGEVGLAGEIRGVGSPARRLAEAARLGFKRAIVPVDNARDAGAIKGMKVLGARMITEAVDAIFG